MRRTSFRKIPAHGTELCTVVEEMFSLEELFEIFGDNSLADRLELLAFNSLPGTTTPDFWAHQYDQQANQVLVSGAKKRLDIQWRFFKYLRTDAKFCMLPCKYAPGLAKVH